MLADCRQHFPGITAGGNDGMSGSECRSGDVDTQSTAGTGDKPNFFLSHVIIPFLTSAYCVEPPLLFAALIGEFIA
ncbi:hypothetical protein D9M71_738510 [compost metagenome]